MDLHALRSFIAVVTHGGFAPASRKLGAPKSTLSRHVTQLENELGVRLLERGPRGFRLTAEGESLSERGTRALAEIDETEHELKANDGPIRGPLRIAVPHVFAHRDLGRLAAAFYREHPEVLLEAVIADRVGDLVAEGLDLAIGVDPPEHADFVVRRLALEELVMVAAPALIRERKRARTPEDAPWPAVVPSRAVPAGERFAAATASRTWSLTRGERRFQIIARPVLRMPSKLAILDAVVAGAGAALMPSSIVATAIASGALVRLGVSEERHVLCIIHPSRRLVSRRVRAFIDFLVESYP